MVRCTLIYQNWSIGLCKSRSVRCCLGQRLHRKDDVSPGCHDRRASSSRLYDGHSLVVRSVRLAAAATAAHDHDEDKDKRAANHSSLTHIRYVIPPDRDTTIIGINWQVFLHHGHLHRINSISQYLASSQEFNLLTNDKTDVRFLALANEKMVFLSVTQAFLQLGVEPKTF